MTELAGGELLSERRGPVQWIVFNRPQAKNALTWAMYDSLVDECQKANADHSVRAMVLTGAGQAFAAGTDIAQFRDFHTLQDALDYEEHSSHVMGTLESVRVPVLAAIAGPCTGGGAAIAACCDLRIASPSTRLGVPIARTLGNCLSHESCARLVGVLGLPRVKDLLLTGRLMDAAELERPGFLKEVVASEEDLWPRAQAIAEALAENAPLTMEASKRALLRIRNRLFPVESDADIIALCYQSADFREGIEAFLAKRKPAWQGR
ncbi:MAG TPA: enoyl-CoA hydratase/isomerase family protein [Candidatus Acidoferrum sp.]|nr:enoyl-CoA hydratase/isomerase family protein [Candidatus Acidoferrum sp.]